MRCLPNKTHKNVDFQQLWRLIDNWIAFEPICCTNRKPSWVDSTTSLYSAVLSALWWWRALLLLIANIFEMGVEHFTLQNLLQIRRSTSLPFRSPIFNTNPPIKWIRKASRTVASLSPLFISTRDCACMHSADSITFQIFLSKGCDSVSSSTYLTWNHVNSLVLHFISVTYLDAEDSHLSFKNAFFKADPLCACALSRFIAWKVVVRFASMSSLEARRLQQQWGRFDWPHFKNTGTWHLRRIQKHA